MVLKKTQDDFDMTDKKLRAILIAVTEVLNKSREVIYNIQDTHDSIE